jgi:predicted transcriptional regulator
MAKHWQKTKARTDTGLLPAFFIDKDKTSPFSKGKRQRNRVRDRIEIVRQILEAANGIHTKKIKMMYKANLSHQQLKWYLVVLTENDLLNFDKLRQTFKTTEKGLRFLEIYGQMENTIMRRREEQHHDQQRLII